MNTVAKTLRYSTLWLSLIALLSCTGRAGVDISTCIPPGTDEICGDGIDQDCNGSDLECPSTGEIRVYSVSSTSLTHGQSYTVFGVGFGTKYPVAPWLYDDFQGGQLGEEILGHLPTVGTVIYEQYASGSGYAIYGDASTIGGNGLAMYYLDNSYTSTSSGNIVVSGQATNRRYLTYKLFRHLISGSGYGVWKIDRQTSNLGNGADNAPYDDPPNFGWGAYIYYNNCQDFISVNSPGLPGNEEWSRIELWETMSNVDTANGAWKIWFDLRPVFDESSIMTCTSACTNGCRIDTWMSPVQVNELEAEDPLHEIWLDNLYIDNTMARIEICDNQDKNSALHCEIQIPHTTWVDGQIQFTANLDSFTPTEISDGLYLYVVNAAGVASNGFQVN